jgi:hypothetical protein
MNDHRCLFCYQLFIIFDIPNGRVYTLLLHCIFYPFISTNKALRLLSGFTWCSYCLICRFLSNVLLTIVFLFVLFISVRLRCTAIDNPSDIFGSFYYAWVWVICHIFLIILPSSSWQKTRLLCMNTNDWLMDWLNDWLID